MKLKLRWLFISVFICTMAVAQSYHNEWIDYNKTYYKFKVMGFGLDSVGAPVRKGMVRVPFSTLAAAGMSGTASGNFQLWRDGEEVAIYVSKPSGTLGSSDYIEFFGEINNGKLDREMYRDQDFQLNDKWSLQTDTAAYFLTVNTASANKRFVNAANNAANSALSATPYFMHTVGRYYRNDISNGFSASLGHDLYSSSYDKGEGWVSRAIRPVAGCGSATLPQNFYNLYPYMDGPLMTMRINTVGDKQNSRTVRININGDSITTYQMDYINYAKIEDTVNVKKISGGYASFQIVNLSSSGCDEMRAGIVELTYPRRFDMGGLSFIDFPLDASPEGRLLKITRFNYGNTAPVLYDAANNKRYVGDISNADTLKFLLEPSLFDYKLVLTTQAGSYYKTITGTQTRSFVNYADASKQGDYLIISNPLIYGMGSKNYVEQYRQYRASVEGGSFNAKIVDINELVDQFAWGIKKHPLSIKNFLRFASDNFGQSPKYAFLIGKGVIYNEYRANESNALADQLNLVPTWGNPASDNLLSSKDLTAVPGIPIGRLSAVSPQEVGDYLLKVKQHDSAQRAPIHTIEARGWMKNVIQIAGANDIGLGDQLDAYLENYKTIISDTAFGANVIDFSKTADPAGYPEAIQSFKKIYENGASLITYFGHSSATSLDFNLDDPGTYNNRYKYPVFIANGCSAGNHFLFEPNRLLTKSTISEKFVLSPERGAVGYLASTHFGVINYLDLYTTDFYKALGNTQYNQSVGTVIKEAIISSLDSTGLNDYYSRVHAEQYAFHGDPAIVINFSALPDYVTEAAQVQVNPSFVSVSDTAFTVKVKVHNIGRATIDPVTFKLTRQTPGGEVFTVATKTFASINLVDSISVEVPIIADRDKGINTITVTADYDNSAEEVSENNNETSIQVLVSEDEIKPVFPYKYAIINQDNLKLYASTVNPLNASREYVLELDTTELFNSSSKITRSQVSAGGVVEFDPGFSYKPNVTYYWRVAPAALAVPHWVSSSFVYKAGEFAGFQQGHFYQNRQSQFTRLAIDSASGRYSYTNKLHNLFITNSVYPTSGTEDEHFSISVDGTSSITSACVGHSVIFNVFDSLTFLPQLNTTNPFGAGEVCAPGREYNFEYSYETPATRKNAMDFLDAIPNGQYVSVRLILDDPYNTTAKKWAADTSVYGKGNSLYHRLKKNGFAQIDSFSFPRTWAFVFRKGDTTFTPAYTFSQGLYDKITLSVNCTTSNTQGIISSPLFGPAKEWKSVIWNGYSNETGNDVPTVEVHGVKTDKSDTLLYTLDSTQHNFQLQVDAAVYPFIRLQMNNKDTLTVTPYQLTNWSLEYLPVPEGALAPNLYFNIPDTLGMLKAGGNTNGDTLKVGVAFKNVSKADFDSLSLKVVLYDSVYNSIEYPVQKLHPLLAGDTLHIDLPLDVSGLSGRYNLFLQVNPNNEQPEQYSFNNFLYKYIFFDKGKVLPVNLVNFNAVLQSGQVRTSWSVTSETNTKQYEVQHATSPGSFSRIGTLTTSAGSGSKDYYFNHLNPVQGKNYYRLKIISTDGSFTYSPARLVTLSKEIVVNVYPNPVHNILTVSVSRQDGKASDIKLINAFGQQLRHQKVNGTALLDVRSLAAGMYMIQVDTGDSISTYKINKQ